MFHGKNNILFAGCVSIFFVSSDFGEGRDFTHSRVLLQGRKDRYLWSRLGEVEETAERCSSVSADSKGRHVRQADWGEMFKRTNVKTGSYSIHR